MAVLAREIRSQFAKNTGTTVLAVAAMIAILYWAQSVFITFFTSVAIAFILEPFVGLLMRIKLPRAVSSFVVCSAALLVMYLIGLGAYTQVTGLMEDYRDSYSQRIAELFDISRRRVEALERAIYSVVVPAKQQTPEVIEPPPPPKKRQTRRTASEPVEQPAPPAETPIPEVRIRQDRSPVTEFIYANLEWVYQVLLMASFVPFLVYFMLSWRDHMYRSFLQFFDGEDRAAAAKSLQGIAGMVRTFVVGNFALGLLLSAASSLIFWKMNLPYPLLVGPLSGFFSLVPYIGLPAALVPPMLVSIPLYPGFGTLLLIGSTVTALHVIALNLLYPKLVGSRVHLNPLVVTVALMIWGFMWGAAGLVLAIPLTAGIKAVCDNVRHLRPYGKLLGD